MTSPNTLFNLKEQQEVRLEGLTFLRVLNIGQPTLKATIDVQILNGDERCIYNSNTEEWDTLEDLSAVVIGMGDRIIIGDVQIMLTSISNKYKTVRLSLRSSDQHTSNAIRKSAGK